MVATNLRALLVRTARRVWVEGRRSFDNCLVGPIVVPGKTQRVRLVEFINLV